MSPKRSNFQAVVQLHSLESVLIDPVDGDGLLLALVHFSQFLDDVEAEISFAEKSSTLLTKQRRRRR